MRRSARIHAPLALIGFAALTLATPHVARGQAFTLGVRKDFFTGASPLWIASGDLNGDGSPDLVTANSTANTVSVYLGTGGGTFNPTFRTDYPVGSSPYAVAVGDLNGDGKPDVVTANNGSSTITVLLGDGAGGLGGRLDLATGAGPYFVAIGDLNGDGRPDLVVANYSAGSVSVLLANASGGFGPKTDFTTGANPTCVAIGDLNGDGKPDLATSDFSSNKASVLLGNGDGTFAARTDYTTGANPFAVAIGDVSGDGKLDVVSANYGANSVSVLQGDGTGALGTHADYATLANPTSVAIADVNGDIAQDVVTSDYGANAVSVLPGNGSGGFGTRVDVSTLNNPHAVVALDINSDGIMDLACVDAGSSSVSVLFAGRVIGFGAKADFATGSEPAVIAVGDMNGDGAPDMVVAHGAAGVVGILAGDGAGGFGPEVNFSQPGNSLAMAIGDLNGDGKLDVVTASGSSGIGVNNMAVLLGDGLGRLGTAISFSVGSTAEGVAIVDANGDGKPDLAVTDASNGRVQLMLGDGTGSFSAGPLYTVGSSPIGIAAADLNGDGHPDLVVANYGANTVSVLLSNGAGGFNPKTDFTTGAGPQELAIADVNGDGKLDVVTANYTASSVSVLLGNGSGSLGTHTDFATGGGPQSVAVADLNNDGKPDIVTGDNLQLVTVLTGNGTGGFGTRTDLSAGSIVFGVGIADLNGDGKPDIAVANFGISTVSVIFASGGTHTTLSVSPNPSVLGTPITLSANVATFSHGIGTPTGHVHFYDGTVLVGDATISAGVARTGWFPATPGSHALSAVYVGDAARLGSFSAVLPDRVTASPAATMTTVKDVRSDHGRQVQIDFTGSGFDFFGSGNPITGYAVYRAAAPAPFATVRPGAASARAGVPGPDGIALAGWDYLLTSPASAEHDYQVVAPTVADSSGLGLNRTNYLVRALTATPSIYFDSAPDSGYSVDNLAVSIPSPFVGAYSGGATHLHWGANTESDFWYYKLYRGASPSFVPGPANLIASSADTGFVDVGSAGSTYKLSAANLSGIESGYAVVSAGTTSAVEGPVSPTHVFLAAPSPNPARAGTTLRFGLVRDALVLLRIYDVNGRLVRELAAGSFVAGEHALGWDLRDAAGNRASAGLYFARLQADGVTQIQRLALAR